ncbi:5-formyltetrahydrofolate cyclo-ligase [Aquipuribacter sp. SD81]|uniref:5-formyltetrahydrofolate cyclo-ligase n=1 Tax=Aquipuribacter sp. SD81 TaxID=3127703 RepID=UPI0030168FA8
MTARHSPLKRPERRAVRARRALADDARPLPREVVADRLAASVPALLALTTAAPPVTVALYVSLPDEPGTWPLRRALADGGHRVLLPVVRDDLDLDWVLDDGATRSARTPPGRRLGRDALAGCALVVVPALAVDRSGTRLGQGGGSYDRALARLPDGVPVVALVHDDEVLPPGALPREPHDRPVGHALTPSGLVGLSDRGRAAPAPDGSAPPPGPPRR